MEDFMQDNINEPNEFKEMKKQNRKRNKEGGGNIFVKIIIFLILIIIACALVFSFWYKNGLKPKKMDKNQDIIFEVKEKTTVKDLGKILEEKGLIKSKKAYELYIKLNKINLINKGKYKANTNMSLEEILNMVEKGKVYKNDIDITFVEGINLEGVIKKVAETTNITEEEMIDALKDGEYLKELCNKYWFLEENEILKPEIKHPLEGYLFPDTYKFDVDKINPKQIIEIMLNQMDKVLKENEKRINEISFNPHEILTLASVVEKEARIKEDRPKVAGLFINRLNKNMPLGSDPTTHYEVGTPLSEPLTMKQLNTEGPYNTRGPNMEGKLPIGPIAMPSKSSIEAVLNYTETKALFFVSDKNGKIYFTNTVQEHEAIIKELKDKNMWYTH